MWSSIRRLSVKEREVIKDEAKYRELDSISPAGFKR